MKNVCIRNFQQQQPSLAERVFIDKTALIIGNVTIGADSSVWPMAVIRGDVAAIKIGQRSNFQDGGVIHVTHASQYNHSGNNVNIGDDVTVGHRVILHGCTIGNSVLIGMGSIIMDGAVIEDQVIIGAGSLVSPHKTLTSGFLYVGSPAKAIRRLTKQEIEFLQYSADSYVKLKNQYLSQN